MGMTVTDLRPGDLVRAFSPALEDYDTVTRIAGHRGVVTRLVDDAQAWVAVVFYDHLGLPIPVYGDPYSQYGDLGDPEWPLDHTHRLVWLMLPEELELIEEEG